MDTRLFLASDEGLLAVHSNAGEWQTRPTQLPGKGLTAVAAAPASLMAGARDGLFRSEDGGEHWEEVADLAGKHVRWLAFGPGDDGLALAGLEPAAIYYSADDGETWTEAPEVAALRDEMDWFLPYSPEAGCVRGFAFHGRRVYAAVEVGGLLRSDDGGRQWRLVDGSDGRPSTGRPQPGYVQSDVHSVTGHPAGADLLYAPTGGGFYVSTDGGATFEPRYQNCYVRAVWVDPADADHLLLGPADGVSRNGRIEESHDQGRSWHLATSGLDTPWPRRMVERFVALPGPLDEEEVLAILSDGKMWRATVGDWAWQRFWPEAPPVRAAAFLNDSG